MAAILAWAAAALLRRTPPPRTGLEWPLIAWFLAAGLSFFVTPSLGTSLIGLKKMAKAAAICLAVAGTARTERRIYGLLIAATAGAALMGLDGLWQVAAGADPLRRVLPGDVPGRLPRLTATYPHANHAAIHGLTVLPACVLIALRAASPRARAAAWSAVGVVAAALILTYSRPGLLGVAAGMGTWLLLRRTWKTLAAGAAAAAAGLLWLPAGVKAWVASQPSWFDALVQPLRKEIWHAAWGMIKASPLIGQGVNTFVLHYSRFKWPDDTQAAAYAHDNLLHMTAEIGVLGLGAFLWLLAVGGGAWARAHRRGAPWVRDAAMALGCGLLAFLAIGLLESSLYSSRSSFLFWMWLGALAALPRAGAASG